MWNNFNLNANLQLWNFFLIDIITFFLRQKSNLNTYINFALNLYYYIFIKPFKWHFSPNILTNILKMLILYSRSYSSAHGMGRLCRNDWCWRLDPWWPVVRLAIPPFQCTVVEPSTRLFKSRLSNDVRHQSCIVSSGGVALLRRHCWTFSARTDLWCDEHLVRRRIGTIERLFYVPW